MRPARAAVPLLLVLVGGAVSLAQSKPDFSGRWILDATKSEFGPLTAPESIVHDVVHKEPNLKVTTTQKSAQGESVTVRNLTTDGQENTNKLKLTAGAEQDVKSISSWNGAKLTTAMKFDMQGTPVAIADIWELSSDGKVLTISRQTTMPEGALGQKFVFNKQ